MGLGLGYIKNIIGAMAIWKMAKNGQKWSPKWKWATVAQLAHPKPNSIWQTKTMVRYLTSIYNLGGLGIWPKPASGKFSQAFCLKIHYFLNVFVVVFFVAWWCNDDAIGMVESSYNTKRCFISGHKSSFMTHLLVT